MPNGGACTPFRCLFGWLLGSCSIEIRTVENVGGTGISLEGAPTIESELDTRKKLLYLEILQAKKPVVVLDFFDRLESTGI